MKLHAQLEKDSLFVCELELCQVRLIPDGELPWILLIPRRENLIDWSDLTQQEQYQLTDEINFVCQKFKKQFQPDKLNIASLGNMVAQLHIHVIARYKNDRAWPHPIWGTSSKAPFSAQAHKEIQDLLVANSSAGV